MNYYLFKRAEIGENFKVLGKGTLFFPENLSVGNDCRIGSGFFIHAGGFVSIGDGTILSRNVCIYSCNHDFLSKTHIPYDNLYIKKKVTIGKSVWIGMNVNITPGVSIGDGAIIGMGSTISKDVPNGVIVVSNIQRIISDRNSEEFRDLLKRESFFAKDFPLL